MIRKTTRKSSVRQKFLRNRGLKKSPRGKVVAHRKDLVLGGKEDLRNMMLKKKSTHKKETKTLLRKIRKKGKR